MSTIVVFDKRKIIRKRHEGDFSRCLRFAFNAMFGFAGDHCWELHCNETTSGSYPQNKVLGDIKLGSPNPNNVPGIKFTYRPPISEMGSVVLVATVRNLAGSMEQKHTFYTQIFRQAQDGKNHQGERQEPAPAPIAVNTDVPEPLHSSEIETLRVEISAVAKKPVKGSGWTVSTKKLRQAVKALYQERVDEIITRIVAEGPEHLISVLDSDRYKIDFEVTIAVKQTTDDSRPEPVPEPEEVQPPPLPVVEVAPQVVVQPVPQPEILPPPTPVVTPVIATPPPSQIPSLAAVRADFQLIIAKKAEISRVDEERRMLAQRKEGVQRNSKLSRDRLDAEYQRQHEELRKAYLARLDKMDEEEKKALEPIQKRAKELDARLLPGGDLAEAKLFLEELTSAFPSLKI